MAAAATDDVTAAGVRNPDCAEQCLSQELPGLPEKFASSADRLSFITKARKSFAHCSAALAALQPPLLRAAAMDGGLAVELAVVLSSVILTWSQFS